MIWCWLFHRRHWHRKHYYTRSWWLCYKCLRHWGKYAPEDG